MNDRGASTVEMSLVLGLLLMIALGAFEYGMAFRSWQGVTAASREGARIGASAGSSPGADCAILEATAAALLANTGDEVVSVDIYETDATSGIQCDTSSYRPFDPSTDEPDNLVCGAWFQMASEWPPSNRDDEGSVRDWIGVAVHYRYHWITGFLFWSGSVDWTSDSTMHLEPVPYS